MLKLEDYMTIVTLWKQGKSKSEISRITGRDRKTIRKVIQLYDKEGLMSPLPIQRASELESYKSEIIKYLEQNLSAVRIHEELSKQGLQAKYRTTSEYISRLKGKQKICVIIHLIIIRNYNTRLTSNNFVFTIILYSLLEEC